MDAQLMGVLSLPFAIDQTAAASLAAAGVNSIRSVPQSGIVVWAAQTVSSQDQWKYVPVRRLTLFIERSLVSGLQWAIFEPNNDPLWAQLAIHVSSFLSTLWHQGAFSGKTQQEAYLVKSGREVMTQNDIDQGAAIVVADFAPVNTTETVALKITVQTSLQC